MNGAQALIRTLVDCGADVCFTNPGTSEMHFVAALDSVPEMRDVLALFEGVATGAADGYARKGHSPVVNVVGDHATYHEQYDAQLESDIETVAGNVSGWLRRGERTDAIGSDAAAAVAATFGPPGQVATLILPADVSWGDGGVVGAPVERATAPTGPSLIEAMVPQIV